MNVQSEMIEDELAKMRQRVDELQKELFRKTSSQAGHNPKEIQQLAMNVDQRFAEVEEKLNDKANKQSVA